VPPGEFLPLVIVWDVLVVRVDIVAAGLRELFGGFIEFFYVTEPVCLVWNCVSPYTYSGQ
jgi:hypothetical protein